MESTFQKRLLEAMDMRGVKAADLARLSGLSKAQISQYMNGRHEARQIALHKLAVALCVSESWLMGRGNKHGVFCFGACSLLGSFFGLLLLERQS